MLELFYILIVVVVTSFVCLSKLKELYTKKGEFTVSKFHLNKSGFSKNMGKIEYCWGRIRLFSLYTLSLPTPHPPLCVHPSPVFSETPHPWYMFNSHLKYFRRVIYIQKNALHLFQKDPVSKVGPPYCSSFLEVSRKCYSSYPGHNSRACFPRVPHLHSCFTMDCREGDL